MLLDELCTLAQDDTPEKRRELLRRVSDLFLDNAGRGVEKHVVLFEDVISRVLDMVEDEARREISERFAREPAAPRAVMMKLARDTAQIAAPVLEHSPVLTEQDLIDVAHGQGDAHRLAIARRASLAEAVTDVLVKKGSARVVATVAGNHGARFSTAGFAELTRRARDDEGLQERLAGRPDLPPAAIDALVPVLSAELLARLERQGVDAGRKLSGELAIKVRKRLTALLAVKDVEARQVPVLLAAIRDGRRDMTSVLVELAEQDRLADIADVIASTADLPSSQVLGVLIAPDANLLAVLVRALSLGEPAFDALIQLRMRRLRQDERAEAAVFERFRDLRPDVALRAIRFHKVRLGHGHAA